MKKTLLATTVASLLTHASISVAQEAADTETLVVTANRFEQSTHSTTLPVVVITKAEIEAIQANDLFEVLRRLPGVQVSSNGGYGQTQSIFVRGTSSDHVLVLIDGVKTASATSGGANISAIPLVGVQRIEFVRGPRAALYGSDAIGGVINIITDTSTAEARASLGFGSNNYQKASLAVAGELSESTSGSFAVKFAETEGFSVQSSSGNEDADGHKVAEFAASISHELNDEVEFKFNSTYSDGEVEYDPADSEKSQQLYSLVGSANYDGENLSSKLAVSKAQDSSYFPSFNGTYQTDSQSVAFTNLYLVNSEFSIGAGVDWYKDDVSETSTEYAETSRTNKSAYLSAFYDNQVFQAEFAVRGDDNQRYGKNSTWQLGLGYRLTDNHRFTANAGTAFKAPTFNDLYYPGGGNSELKPEESTNYEIALEGQQAWIDWRVAAYQNNITNMLVGWPVENVGKAEIKGVEISGLFETGAFSHEVSLDFMDPKDTVNDVQLSRRAKQSAKWNASYVADEWQADISYLYQGKRLGNDGNTDLGAYSLVDVAASYFVTEHLTARGRIANLFDQNYVLAKGYNTQERSFFINLDYKF